MSLSELKLKASKFESKKRQMWANYRAKPSSSKTKNEELQINVNNEEIAGTFTSIQWTNFAIN